MWPKVSFVREGGNKTQGWGDTGGLSRLDLVLWLLQSCLIHAKNWEQRVEAPRPVVHSTEAPLNRFYLDHQLGKQRPGTGL